MQKMQNTIKIQTYYVYDWFSSFQYHWSLSDTKCVGKKPSGEIIFSILPSDLFFRNWSNINKMTLH